MKTVFTLLTLLVVLTFTGCTRNQCAKTFGGSMVVKIEADQKFVNATWKEANLWVITRSMRKDEIPERYFMTEKSSFGLIEGTIIFEESRK